MTSKLVLECPRTLYSYIIRPKYSHIGWVPGHRGRESNEEADRLAKQESKNSFGRPEATLTILKCQICANYPRNSHGKFSWAEHSWKLQWDYSQLFSCEKPSPNNETVQ